MCCLTPSRRGFSSSSVAATSAQNAISQPFSANSVHTLVSDMVDLRMLAVCGVFEDKQLKYQYTIKRRRAALYRRVLCVHTQYSELSRSTSRHQGAGSRVQCVYRIFYCVVMRLTDDGTTSHVAHTRHAHGHSNRTPRLDLDSTNNSSQKLYRHRSYYDITKSRPGRSSAPGSPCRGPRAP